MQASVLNPDGTTLANFSGQFGDGSLATVSLPVNGTYTVLVDPVGSATGSKTVQLNNVP
jgi:hypothetical protein